MIRVSQELLENLVALWHDGAWPNCELPDVICEATGWTHVQYDHWVVTGDAPLGSRPEPVYKK